MAPSITQLSCLALLASTTLATPSPLKLDFTREKRTAPLARRASGDLNLALNQNSDENSYIIKLSVGTPAQDFKLILDTGSSDLWVPAATDTICTSGSSDECVFGTYTSSESSTYALVDAGAFEISYGDGSMNEGNYISDVVTIGGVTVKNVTLGLALQSSSEIAGETAQGLLGVGYRDLSSAGGLYPTLIDGLYSNGVIERRAFSLYLNDAQSGTGSILFGGIDTDKYTGSLVSLPVVPDTIDGQGIYARYLVDLTSISFTTGSSGSSSAITPSGMATAALLDSGTTSTIVSSEIFNNVVKGIGAVALTEDGETIYVVECSAGDGDAALAYQFGGSDGPIIRVPISAILEDAGGTFTNGAEACVLLMEASDASLPETILGDSFLRNAYVVYDLDNNEIAIAQAKLNSTSENIQVIPSGTGLSQVSSTATATASPYTLDNAGGSTAEETATAAVSTAVGAAGSDVTAGSATYTGITATGSAASSSAAGAANSITSVPMGTMHVAVFVSVAACFFAGMIVL